MPMIHPRETSSVVTYYETEIYIVHRKHIANTAVRGFGHATPNAYLYLYVCTKHTNRFSQWRVDTENNRAVQLVFYTWCHTQWRVVHRFMTATQVKSTGKTASTSYSSNIPVYARRWWRNDVLYDASACLLSFT